MSLKLALEWVEKGFAVIPVGANKVPLLKDWTNTYAATSEAATALFTKNPKAQVGLVTGAPSNVVVIDIDHKDIPVAQLLQELIQEGWPKTMMAQTQGGGLHLFYSDPGGIKTSTNWRHNIDIRADGGQVVAPGSKGVKGMYKLLTNGLDPQPLPFELALKLPRKDGPPLNGDTPNPSTAQGHGANDGLIVSGMPFTPPTVVRSGERDATIFRYAASMQARGIEEGEATKQISAYYEQAVKDKAGFSLADALEKVTQVYGRYAENVHDVEIENDLETPNPVHVAALHQKIYEALERYIFVVPDGAYFDQWTGGWVKPKALSEAMMRIKAWTGEHKKGGDKIIFDLWMRFKTNRAVRCVDGVCYKPEGELITLKKQSKFLNLWTRPAIDPTPGDCSGFINHLREMVDGDEVSMTFIIDWMAHLVQFPGEKIGSTVLLSSTEEGLGKSLIGKVLQTILGPKNVAYIGATHLGASFNEWLEHSALAIVEEFSAMGKWGVANKLKDMVTNDTVRINAKFRSEYTAENHTNFLFFSNYPDAAALGSVKERRTFIHHTDITKDELAAKYKVTKEVYYGALWDWARGDGPSYFAHFLLSRDIQAFRAWGRFEPPATDSKRFAVSANLSPFEEWLEEQFEDRAGPFQKALTSKGLIQSTFEMQASGKWQDRYDHELKRFIRARLMVSGAIKLNGKSVRVQSVDDHFAWKTADHADRSTEYKDAVAAAMGR